jgi:hypothetical protein
MKLPHAARVVIAPEKLRGYLLNPGRRRGGTNLAIALHTHRRI